MSMYRLATVAALAAALGACGGEEGKKQIIPSAQLEDPVAYFGMQMCTCYEYAPESGGPEMLGVAVETTTDRFSAGSGIQETVVRYRRNGVQFREDVFRATDPDLLLSATRIGSGATEQLWTYNPPLPYVRFPAKAGLTVTAETQMKLFGGDTQKVNFRANYVSEAVDGVTTTRGDTEETMADAVRTSYTFAPGDDAQGPLDRTSDPFRWFVPNTGWAKLEFELDGKRSEWVLRNVRPIADCPTDYATRPTDICGTTSTN